MSSAAALSELDKLGNSKVSGAAEAFHGAFAGGDRLWVSTVWGRSDDAGSVLD